MHYSSSDKKKIAQMKTNKVVFMTQFSHKVMSEALMKVLSNDIGTPRGDGIRPQMVKMPSNTTTIAKQCVLKNIRP